ncbi:MAG: carboxypeptidase-like regulatory domain-containing protein, partial [Blastocatellia bacterium]
RKSDGTPGGFWGVKVLKDGQQAGFCDVNAELDGLYSIRNLAPGTYEVQVTSEGAAVNDRPQRIWGVTNKAGRTLNTNRAASRWARVGRGRPACCVNATGYNNRSRARTAPEGDRRAEEKMN